MRFKFLFLILGLMVSSVSAQVAKNISIQTSYDDNAFRNYAGLSDYATQFSLYLAKDSGGESWQSRLFYKGNYNFFTEYRERNYHYHQVGAAWSRLLNDSGNALNLGVNGSFRVNRNTYDYYNYKEVSGYGNFKIKFGPSTVTYFGYKIRGRWYSNIPDLTYAEHFLFVRYTHFFATKTTFMVAGNYGRKTYRQQVTDNTIFQQDMGDYGQRQGGMGHIGRGDYFGTTNSNVIKPSVSQWVGQLRVAQSLTSSTGLSSDFILRRNPGDGVRYLAGQVSGYTTEDELFDDRYGYQSQEFASTLTQLLPWEMTLKSGLELKWKDYVDRPALDLSGEALISGELRSDRQVLAWLSLNKTFTLFGGKSLNVVGEFYWMNNQSNDLYYDYQVNLISLGMSTSF